MKETRIIDECSIRSEDGDTPTITGYAAVFDSPTQIMNFTEVVKPGAFTRAINENQDVRALVDHDKSKIIGRTKAGTLTLTEDDKGLRAEITPPNTTIGRDLVENIRNGNISQMSFGFTVKDEEITRDDKGMITRNLTDLNLFDVSAVTYPAYKDTEIAVRSETTEQIDKLVSISNEEPEEVDPIDVDNDKKRSLDDYKRIQKMLELK